jgi:hypothetical protein
MPGIFISLRGKVILPLERSNRLPHTSPCNRGKLVGVFASFYNLLVCLFEVRFLDWLMKKNKHMVLNRGSYLLLQSTSNFFTDNIHKLPPLQIGCHDFSKKALFYVYWSNSMDIDYSCDAMHVVINQEKPYDFLGDRETFLLVIHYLYNAIQLGKIEDFAARTGKNNQFCVFYSGHEYRYQYLPRFYDPAHKNDVCVLSENGQDYGTDSYQITLDKVRCSPVVFEPRLLCSNEGARASFHRSMIDSLVDLYYQELYPTESILVSFGLNGVIRD